MVQYESLHSGDLFHMLLCCKFELGTEINAKGEPFADANEHAHEHAHAHEEYHISISCNEMIKVHS